MHDSRAVLVQVRHEDVWASVACMHQMHAHASPMYGPADSMHGVCLSGRPCAWRGGRNNTSENDSRFLRAGVRRGSLHRRL